MSITVSPLSQTVSEGGIATFTAITTGIKTREFEYEWIKYKETGTVGSNRSLIINNVTVEDAGSYYSCVTNEWNNKKCSVLAELTSKLQIIIIHMHNY